MLLNNKNIIELDLSEYKEYHTISKLIGTTAGYLGYDNKNNVFEKVRTNPNIGIIVDNFDSACMEVKNLFLKIIENGKIDDASGKVIDFSNAIIIFNKNIDKSSKLGFSNSTGKENKELNNLDTHVYQKIVLEDLNYENKKKLFYLKIDTLTNKYDNINIIIDSRYKNNLLEKLKDKKDISKFYSELENKIVEAIIDNKKTVIIKDNSNIKV